MCLDSISAFTEALQGQSVVFFTGSGISLDSGLASVTDVLERTVDKLLPSMNGDQRSRILNTQPELFYSILLESCHSDPKCMDMWKCLNPTKWTKDYTPRPNFVHGFIAAASYLAELPVFTVNYDTMFEEACKILKIPYIVLTDPPAPPVPEPVGDRPPPLRICKLHGSVEITDTGDVDLLSFKTTMTEISRYNRDWMKYLGFFAERCHFCFAGYSGRDIDFYPHMRDFLKDSDRRPFWFMSKKTVDSHGSTYINAADIDPTCVIPEYTNKIFPGICDAVFRDTGYLDDLRRNFDVPSRLSREREVFLNHVKDRMTPVSIDPDFFWIMFCRYTGLNEMAADAIACFHPDQASMENWKYDQLLTVKMMVARERAQFWQYRTAAWELLHTSLRRRSRTPEEDLHILDAGLQLVSAGSMDIPHYLYFPLPLCYRKYGLALLARLKYTILIFVFRIFCRHREKRWSGFREMASFIMQEARLRALAVDVGFCQVFQTKLSQRICIDRLKLLWAEASESGNYITATNVYKYLDRLSPNQDYRTYLERAVSMTYDISARAIMKRDTSNFDDGLNDAMNNGNTLNIIKILLGMAHKTYVNKGTPLLPEEKQETLFNKMRDVQSKHLSKAFAYICRKYFGHTAFYKDKKLTIL